MNADIREYRLPVSFFSNNRKSFGKASKLLCRRFLGNRVDVGRG